MYFLFTLKQFTENKLYDYYRFNKIVVKVIPEASPTYPIHSLTSPGPGIRRIYGSVVDFDDNQKPTKMGDIEDLQNFRMSLSDRIHTRIFTPHVLGGVQKDVTSFLPAIIMRPKQWMNTAYNEVPHLGLKLWFEGSTIPLTYKVVG